MTTPYVRAETPTSWPDCILWAGRVNKDGYGTIGSKLAHKAEWEKANGPVPPGLVLDHRCRVRLCVNASHLEPVTAKVNRERQELTRVLVQDCRHGHKGEYRQGRDGKRYCAGCKRDRGRRDRARHAG